ncbi:acetate--CoA ligase family protein [Castellaniella hirudinis]|uniref:Acetate--CoA ligase family protein n=1 Tax=Castellaniella hirudinis TaxID=1144617 RepID=A0ABV8RYR9_9BURK
MDLCSMDMEQDSAVDRMMEPRSIAIVGASSDARKRGYQIVESLVRNGYPHPIYPINPKGGAILGIPVLSSIDELPLELDLAVIARPADQVIPILEACCRRRVAGAVILASGFKESGPDGARRQEALQSFLATHDIRVIGPNTSGIINFNHGADLVGLKQQCRIGPISAVTQSGNMLLSLLADIEHHRTPGLDAYAGLGNQADVDVAELILAFSRRASTKAIAVHAEGLHDGRALIATAAEVSRGCPIVLVRGGRSEAGRHTALSHTGSVSGSDRVATGLLGQAGIIQVERVDELAVVAGALSSLPLPKAGKGVAIVSDGGGHATLAADSLTAAGLRLATLSEQARQALHRYLGATAAVSNPIDVASAGDASPRLFAQCIELLQSEPDVGVILVVGLLGGYHLRFDPEDEVQENAACLDIGRTAAAGKFPVVVHSCYEHRRPAAHQHLREHGIPVLGSIEHAVSCVQALVRRSHWLATAAQRTDAQALGRYARPTGQRTASVLSEPEARASLAAAGVDTGPWLFAENAAQARAHVAALGRPCAFKIVADGISHKSDVGGVRLNVGEDLAETAWTGMVEAVRRAHPDSAIRGVIVTPMIDAGTELLIGVTVDPGFGPMIAFGAGGVTIEALQDIAFRALPLTELEAKEMILETRIAKILAGYRRLPSIDMDTLARFIVDIGASSLRMENLADLEFNPVILNQSGLHIADVRLISAP